jgi:prophage regulatory protein
MHENPKLLRLSSILGPIGPLPVSRSTWYAGIKSGRYPAPLSLGPHISVWRSEDIAALINEGTSEARTSSGGARSKK